MERIFTTDRYLKFTAGILAFLWFYAASSKLAEFGQFSAAMNRQPLWPVFRQLLQYGLPPLEVLTGALLLSRRKFFWGLGISAALLLSFVLYIGLILCGAMGSLPCACGGLIAHLGWTFHLYFNLFFLALTVTSLYVNQRKEGGDNK